MIDEKFTRECADVYCIAFEQARKRCKNDVLSMQAAQVVLQAHIVVHCNPEERQIKAAEEVAERRAEEKILKMPEYPTTNQRTGRERYLYKRF